MKCLRNDSGNKYLLFFCFKLVLLNKNSEKDVPGELFIKSLRFDNYTHIHEETFHNFQSVVLKIKDLQLSEFGK